MSVISEGPFFHGFPRAVSFRAWLESVPHKVERLPSYTFRESGSGANARLVTIEKQEGT